ncbi:MAG: hypothetical protein JNM63_06695, partial [Spirochaetia bacterium]|nr:hypothetical protein [Spirochaetia bacterium]
MRPLIFFLFALAPAGVILYAADKPFDGVARDKYLSFGIRTNDIAKTFHSRTIQKQLFF